MSNIWYAVLKRNGRIIFERFFGLKSEIGFFNINDLVLSENCRFFQYRFRTLPGKGFSWQNQIFWILFYSISSL